MIDFLFLENLCRISIAFRHTIEVSPKVNVCEQILVVQVIVLGQSRLNMLTKQEICGTFLQPKVNISYIQQTMGYCVFHRRSWHGPSPFSNFLFTNLFSIKFLYFFIISSLFPFFNLFVSIIFSRTWWCKENIYCRVKNCARSM